MTGAILMPLVALFQAETFIVQGRDYVSVDDSVEVFRGTCDAHAVSATLTKAFDGAVGTLVLRAGRLSREVPDSFLDGRMFESTHYAAGLGCDGTRIMFRARATQLTPDGRVVVRVQHVTMNMRTGELSMSSIRTMPPDEVSRELQ